MAQPAVMRILLEREPEEGEDPEPREGPFPLRAGGLLRGTVEVEVREECQVGELTFTLGWHTGGRGNPVNGPGGWQLLAKDVRWPAGSLQRFPVSLRVPWGPLSYSGKILQILWEAEARVHGAAPGPSLHAVHPVAVVARREMPEVNLGPVPQQRQELEARKRGLGRVWVAVGLALMMGGVLLGAALSWDLALHHRMAIFLLILSGFLVTLRGIWGRLGRGKLGEPTVNLSTVDLRRGEEIRFSVGIRSDRPAELRTLEAILECEERVVHGQGQYRTHHRRTVYEKRILLAEDLLVEAHRGLRKKGIVTVPEDAPCTFAAPDNQVVWWLRFEGDLVGWPDWREPHLVTVRP